VKEVVVESVEDWPESIADGETEITGATKAGLTVTATALEATVTGVPEPSVTCSSKFQVPVEIKAPVESDGLSPGAQLKELPRLM
jgi:hypothetical protein